MMSTHPSFTYQRKDLPEKVRQIGIGLLTAGGVFVALAYLVDPARAAVDNVVGFLFLCSIVAGSLFLVALEYIGGAVWSVPIRRVNEFLVALLPLIPVVALPVFARFSDVFTWIRPDVVAGSAVLQGKTTYLNFSFFIVRIAAVLALWGLFAFFFLRNSKRQDATGDQSLTRWNIRLAAVFMPVLAITLTVVAIDWAMSITPIWYSTIFGVYYFSGTVLAGVSGATFIVVLLYEHGYFPALRRDHFYSLGALMFAFVNFWAYIAFSQFLLIWYANLPEETAWFIQRWHHGWQYISVLQIVVHFLVPYFALLTQDSKMDLRRLKVMSVWILFAHFLDVYWLVVPGYSEELSIGWGTLGFPLLIAGAAVWMVFSMSRRNNLIPIGDPKLQRGLNFRL
jgi:hypothetical protein